MTITTLIEILKEAHAVNGGMTVNLCVDGNIYKEIDVNCADDILYVEGYDKI